MNLPNQLTVLRIILAAVFTFCLSIPFLYSKTLALIIFIVASITDIYDGKIARATGIITTFGKLMDPLADKILISAAFILFINIDPIWLPSWMIIVIISREFLITGIRLLALSESKVIPADTWGKTKTISQITTIIIILLFLAVREIAAIHFKFWNARYDIYVHQTSVSFVVVTMFFTIHSGINYLKTHKEFLKG